MEEFGPYWEGLENPRTGNAAPHNLHDLLIIAPCTVLRGGENATDMAEFAKVKEPLLRGFLQLANGVPSHDTFSRLFRLLDPGNSVPRFSGTWRYVRNNARVLSRSTARFSTALTTVPVANRRCTWSAPGGCAQRMVLGQIATNEKSNEITAVPRLLEMSSLKNTIVTVDALNCQRAIAQQIIDQGADYALALKDNQKTLHADRCARGRGRDRWENRAPVGR